MSFGHCHYLCHHCREIVIITGDMNDVHFYSLIYSASRWEICTLNQVKNYKKKSYLVLWIPISVSLFIYLFVYLCTYHHVIQTCAIGGRQRRPVSPKPSETIKIIFQLIIPLLMYVCNVSYNHTTRNREPTFFSYSSLQHQNILFIFSFLKEHVIFHRD